MLRDEEKAIVERENKKTMLRDEEKAMVERENKKTMLRYEEKAIVEGENKKTMLRDEEKAMVEGEKGRVNIDTRDRLNQVFEVKPIVKEGLNHAVNYGTENLVQQEVTIFCSE